MPFFSFHHFSFFSSNQLRSNKFCRLLPSVIFLLAPVSFTSAGQETANAAMNVLPSAQNESQILQCPLIEIPKIAAENQSTQKHEITIYSKNTSVLKNKFANFTGGVTLVSNNQRIAADSLKFNRENSAINAKGSIHFQNNSVDVFADSLSTGNSETATLMQNTAYHLANTPGHGSAKQIAVNKNGSLTLDSSSFTTCQSDDPDWQLQASEITISASENFGEAYNARFRLFDVPVLYIPYFTFPVTDQRKTGLLYPQFSSSSKRGLELKTPFYWNIAENIDATITPRYMSKRGLQVISELRYLSNAQSGKINIEYLSQDNDYQNSNARYLGRFQHTGNFLDNFRAHVDYTTTSDDNYFVDLGSEHYNANDTYLYQIGELAYFGSQWQATIKVQDFEVLGNHLQSYKTIPQVEINSYQALPFYHAQFELNAELSRFDTPDRTKPIADRYHVEAGITLPFSSPAWFFNSEFKVLQTTYTQKRLAENSVLDRNVNRTLPKVRFHGGLNLDRSISAFGKSLTQTLEPQLQYLYIPEKDQSNIGLYDTTPLQDDFDGLFRDIRFSGLDRIAKANQYSWGITSRLLTAENQELFRLSLGKIVYLNKSNVQADILKGIAADQSALAADLFIRLNNNWQFSSDIQYSTEEKFTNKSQMKLDYRYASKYLVQLNHRFNRDVSGVTIEQASLLASVALNQNWHFIGRATQDLQEKRNLESYLGFQYESCCWAVRFAYHRSIDTNLEQSNLLDTNHNEFNNGFMLEFVIKGLSGKQSSVSTEDMFNSSIFGYKRPYFLNN
jgi:LPS-assembly protein